MLSFSLIAAEKDGDEFYKIAERYYWSSDENHFSMATKYYEEGMQNGNALSIMKLAEIYYFGLNGKVNQRKSRKMIELILKKGRIPHEIHQELFIASTRYTDELYLMIVRCLIDEKFPLHS